MLEQLPPPHTSHPLFKSLILVILGGGLLSLAVLRLRQYRLKERYALVFLLLGLPFLGLAVWPNAIDYFSHFLDIDYRTMTLLCVTTFLTLAVFELLTIVSRQDQKINSLAQLVGILMEKQNLADPEHRPEAKSGSDDSADSKREAA